MINEVSMNIGNRHKIPKNEKKINYSFHFNNLIISSMTDFLSILLIFLK